MCMYNINCGSFYSEGSKYFNCLAEIISILRQLWADNLYPICYFDKNGSTLSFGEFINNAEAFFIIVVLFLPRFLTR